MVEATVRLSPLGPRCLQAMAVTTHRNKEPDVQTLQWKRRHLTPAPPWKPTTCDAKGQGRKTLAGVTNPGDDDATIPTALPIIRAQCAAHVKNGWCCACPVLHEIQNVVDVVYPCDGVPINAINTSVANFKRNAMSSQCIGQHPSLNPEPGFPNKRRTRLTR